MTGKCGKVESRPKKLWVNPVQAVNTKCRKINSYPIEGINLSIAVPCIKCQQKLLPDDFKIIHGSIAALEVNQ